MIINENNVEEFTNYGKAMADKWAPILEQDGEFEGNQYVLEQTAILLENFLGHLTENPMLIAEDEIQSGNFKGVNLALMGLLKRAIPKFVAGTDLVGMQSMPTPKSPIFYMYFKKAFDQAVWDKNTYAGGNASGTGADFKAKFAEAKSALSPKGDSFEGEELWGYPGSGEGEVYDIDPYFTSNFVFKKLDVKSAVAQPIKYGWTPLIASTLRLVAYNTDGKVAKLKWNNDAITDFIVHVDASLTDTPVGVTALAVPAGAVSVVAIDGVTLTAPIVVANLPEVTSADATEATVTLKNLASDVLFTADEYIIRLEWSYLAESNSKMPEMTSVIQEESVELIKRNLRGKYTFDAMTDSKVLHGINLESEIMDTMRLELTNEMSREIIKDLLQLAAIRKTVDYTAIDFGAGVGVSPGNYQDVHMYLLDIIAGMCSEIWVQGRMGRGNFVVGNPTTLTFLERVAGFRESGVDYGAAALTFKGRLGKINFYEDPLFPKNKLLMGYKGSSSLETGYIFAPYQPIIAMPTLMDPMTGDYRKIFQTRYGKSFQFKSEGPNKGKFVNAIYRGGYQYAVLTLKNFPTINNFL